MDGAPRGAIQPGDLRFFSTLAAAGSLSAAARQLGLTTAAVSKRLAQLEARLALPLVQRTTRRMSLTVEGELLLERARHIIGQLDALGHELGNARGAPQGLLAVQAPPALGRGLVAPAISRFLRLYPKMELTLSLGDAALPTDPLPTVPAVALTLVPRPDDDPEQVTRLVARRRRLLAAAPAYLEQHGTPRTPAELARHEAIAVREPGQPHEPWWLARPRGADGEREIDTVQPLGRLVTDDAEVAVRWALDGHGIVLGPEWELARHLESGRLVQVLAGWQTPQIDIHAVFPRRHEHSLRLRTFVAFLADTLAAPPG